jgi:hypothetical protein
VAVWLRLREDPTVIRSFGSVAALVFVVAFGAIASASAASEPRMSLAAALTAISTVPKSPAGDTPFKGPTIGHHDGLRQMLPNPGGCAYTPPPAGCHRWAAEIRHLQVVGIPERDFSGRHGYTVSASAYVFREQQDAKQAFVILRGIWTQGIEAFDVFPVKGLGTQETGLWGSGNPIEDTYQSGYLWRFENVVFELLLYAPYGELPPLSEQHRFNSEFLSYADAVQQRATTLA